MVGIVACVIVNYYLILQHRARDESIQRALTYTPVVWGSLTCVGLVIIIPQMWADFTLGPDALRRSMVSLIGVGLCGTYGGYVTLIAMAPKRIYGFIRMMIYLVLIVVALEILDAIWLVGRELTGEELLEQFVNAGWAALAVLVIYSVIAGSLAQMDTGNFAGVLFSYGSLGIVGFTVAVWFLWRFLEAGPIRLTFGGVVLVAITTIGLLLVQYVHGKYGLDNPPADASKHLG